MPLPSDSLFPSDDLFPSGISTLETPTDPQLSSTINEEYSDPRGSWANYDTYDPGVRAILRGQKHVDIRNFRSSDVDAPINVLELSRYPVNELEIPMSDIEGLTHAIKEGEHWTAGTSATSEANNYWNFLSLPVTAGTTDTKSVATPVNLWDGFDGDDFVSLALPNFPLASINTATSLVQMTSNPDGDFSIGPVASVALNTSIVSLVAGNSEFRVLRSAFNQNDIDISTITAVRLRIVATGVATVTFGAFRLLSKNWKFGSIDTDTRLGLLVRPVSPNGDPAYPIEFTQPIMWRAAEVPGDEDPRPIDFEIAVAFNTGAQSGANQISMYGRELTEDFMQQIDINGSSQGNLDGREQPDLGAAMYNPRLQTDLEPFKQDQLGGLRQYDLERTPDYLSASWVEFVVQWTEFNTQLSVVSAEGEGYSFNLLGTLLPNTDYVLVFRLVDTAVRAAIYPLGDRGQIEYTSPVFDSTLIDDDFVYKRRKGRFGWYAQLQDGDAWVESVRFRSASYAEYRSLPYESLTPVVGAELSAEASPVIELFEYFVTTNNSVTVERDRELSVTGESWRVTDRGGYAYQGMQSNLFEITDFDQTEISLDVYYPSAPDLDAGVEFFLKSPTNYLIALPNPKLYPDQWQSIRLRPPASHLAQTGFYRLVVVQSFPFNINWWVDNVRIFERTVSWYGRAVVDDPWAITEDDWTPFQNSFNRDYGGILFRGRERKMQVKAIGHKRNSVVKKVQFKPRYAELGRFVWPEDQLVGLIEPTASYVASNTGRIYTFNGYGSSDIDGQVINWYWTISDGTVLVGPIVEHEFGAAGTYSVTLTVTDNNGLINTTSASHSVA